MSNLGYFSIQALKNLRCMYAFRSAKESKTLQKKKLSWSKS